MGKIFGTDGIRGKANTYPMTPEVALRVGRALVTLFKDNDIHQSKNPFIIIGQDTRISGDMIAASLAAGALASGIDVCMAGILPTPGVAYLTTKMSALAGVVISASHNPYEDNGIKIFASDGYKLTDEQEAEIESVLLNESPLEKRLASGSIPESGVIRQLPQDVSSEYLRFLMAAAGENEPFSGLKVIVDCSHGATYKTAPALFKNGGAEITAMNILPDGRNINAGCGSEHPENLSKKVVERKADIGLAFDGDGDRLIAVDEKGELLSGDQMIAIFAGFLKEEGLLRNNTVVTTVMSNVGLGDFLASKNIRHVMADVGDRHVVKELVALDAILGGEDSGHMVFRDVHTTGDGLLSAIHLLKIMKKSGQPLSHLSSCMRVYPQVLKNVVVKRKPPLDTLPEVAQCIRQVETEIGGKGRVLVRYSGTQSMCRVMVEGPTQEAIDSWCERIAAVIKKSLA